PSLCAGWRVHDVAAHLTLAPTATYGALVRGLVRGRGSFDRTMDLLTREAGTRPREDVVAALRTTVTSRHLAPGPVPRAAPVAAPVPTHDAAAAHGVPGPAPPVAAPEAGGARCGRARVGRVLPVPRPAPPRRVPPRRRRRALAPRRRPAGHGLHDRPAPAAHRATRGPRPPRRGRRARPRPLVRAARPGGAP